MSKLEEYKQFISRVENTTKKISLIIDKRISNPSESPELFIQIGISILKLKKIQKALEKELTRDNILVIKMEDRVNRLEGRFQLVEKLIGSKLVAAKTVA